MQTTIKTITPKTFQNKPNGFSIVLVDGTEGNLAEKTSDKGLRAGDPVEATIQDYVSKAGKHSNLITLKLMQPGAAQTATVLPQTVNPPVNKPAPLSTYSVLPKSKEQVKIDAFFKATDKVTDLVLGGKMTWEKYQEGHQQLTTFLYGEIDKIFKSLEG
jgi:hypothetical protein